MFSAVVLVLVCLMQMKLVTTEGHRGTNVFYAVQMDRGIRAARALAEQHTLEFIQQAVFECLGTDSNNDTNDPWAFQNKSVSTR
ncbi:hypothetical protein KUCAC02_013931 [Chaenocephalus aceratus]|uniref:Uncharacterized protein n=1 Tax=Chaenocephalus aceratus TaxID=36190 RepID=A0ACB9WDM3_CHAAC|nr:hypothetical protein KUCAC02_013931 [Chaenocephalus aceratus]